MRRTARSWIALGTLALSLLVAAPGRGEEKEAGLPPPIPYSPPLLTRDDLAARIKPAPLEARDRPLPVNLATALRLADARPLVVVAAQVSSFVAQAQLERARVLWVPTLNTGFDYYRHDGGSQNIQTGNLEVQSTNFFYAGGGGTLIVATTDAIFTPLAARQVLNARRANVQAAKNDAMLSTSEAYFNVHQQRGTYAGALDALARGRDLVRRINSLGQNLVPEAETDRAKNLVAVLEQEATTARERWRVASVNLTRVLRLDPTAVIVPLEPDHLQITVVDPNRCVDDLIAIGLTNRPELALSQALVQATLARLRQEKMRPLLPSVLITGFQTPEFLFNGGIFGTGPNSKLNQWDGRVDLSYQLVWQLENMGLGTRARIREAQGTQAQAIVELFKVQDQVAAEVAEAEARLESARDRVGQADRSLREALITFDANLRGLSQTTRFEDILVLVYRPQEVVVALEHLKAAYDEFFGTVADYNRSEFQLYHALGYPAQGLACAQPPGDIVPVNTARPNYMPPVAVPALPR
jgi:outer membrane protein TolC